MRTFALAIAAMLLLSSCGDEQKPIEPKPSASDEPTAAAPTIPGEAKENSPEGAANFVKYWIDTSNYSARTGDTSKLKDLSDPDCDGCGRYIDLYDSIYESGGYIKGRGRSIGDLDLEITDQEVYVRGQVSAAEGRYRNNKSSPELKSPADVTMVEFAVVFANQEWRMTQMGLPTKD